MYGCRENVPAGFHFTSREAKRLRYVRCMLSKVPSTLLYFLSHPSLLAALVNTIKLKAFPDANGSYHQKPTNWRAAINELLV